ncbi:hypothetical protein AB9P05_23095 [Roseivirga sp. BDSF3-8]|uniref:hypothetical protein n=1 Tax=Roseivirga sp. BDSF3-8 TaxID=3241598 RepID=UPI0035320292
MTNKELVEKFNKINKNPFGSMADGNQSYIQWCEIFKVAEDIADLLSSDVELLYHEDNAIAKVYEKLVKISFQIENEKSLDKPFDEIQKLHNEVIKGVQEVFVGTQDELLAIPYSQSLLAIRNRLRGEYYAKLFAETGGFEFRNRLKELNDGLDAVKEISAKAASEQYAKVFHQEADSNKNKSMLWLGAGILVLIGFILAFNTLNAILLPGTKQLEAITDASYLIGISILSRALTITIGFFVLRFIVRHYNVQRHLYTENKHRASALDAFKLFVNSVKDNDPVAHNALVLEVAKAISQPPQSGYLGSKSDGQTNVPYSDLVKILANTKGKV